MAPKPAENTDHLDLQLNDNELGEAIYQKGACLVHTWREQCTYTGSVLVARVLKTGLGLAVSMDL